MSNDDNSWRTPSFRQNIVNKIDEAIQAAGMSTARNSREMETHVFEKSKTREEYVGFVARLILHVREVLMKKNGMVNSVGLGVGGMGMMQGIPDPINALQTLARQGTGVGPGSGGGPGGQQPPNSTTLLQTLNQRPGMQRMQGLGPNVQGQQIPGQMQGQMQGPMPNQMGQMGGQMGGQMNQMGGQMGGQMGPMTGPMGAQMGAQMTRQMQGQMPGQMQGQLAGHMASGMNNQMQGQMGGQMGTQMGGPMQNQMQGQMAGQMGGPMGGQMAGQMAGQMGGQMVGQMAGQMSNQMAMNGQIPSQMQAQLSVQMNGQMPAQLGGQMGSQMPPQLSGPSGQMPNQINGQMSGQMLSPMNNHIGGQIGGPMPGQMNGQIGNQLGNQMQGNLNSAGPNQMMNQMGPQIANQMGGQMHGQIGGQLQQSSGTVGNIPMQNQMGGSMGGQMGNQMHSQMPNQLNPGQMHMGQRKGNESAMMNQNANFVGPRNVTPNQFLRQSPSPSVQSPASIGAGPPSNQMASSPAVGLAPSPGSQLGSVSGQQRSIGVALSPGSSLNTPGQAQPTPSPLAQPSPEEQAYREKIRYLSKYIDPLRRMIVSMSANAKDGDKMSKMKHLLDLLSNPNKRTQIETLNKCEVVLEKLDFARYIEHPPAHSPSNLPAAASMGSLKDNVLFRPLLEAVSSTLQSPMANHTLQRTFGATNIALFGSDLKLLPPPKKKKVEEVVNDIPEILQGEIARLDQRFKVSLDQTQQSGANSIHLLCWLDDRHLPCVPPVSLTVPEDYPASPPRCTLGQHDYGATDFLQAVQTALDVRMKKLPVRFSVSQLLHTWEMAVRQASAPSSSQPSATTVLLGL